MKNGMRWKIPPTMIVFGLVMTMTGCLLNESPDPPFHGGGGTITWTATAFGAVTTEIYFSFSSAPTGLASADITITGLGGSATRGTLWHSSTTSRVLTVYNVVAGTVSISINRPGFASGPQQVMLSDASGARNITVNMRGQQSDSWTGSALRISVNGIYRWPDATISSGTSGNVTFNANVGNNIRVYWVSGNFPSELAFAIFYTDNPPSPAFNPDTWATNDTARLLVHWLYGSLSSIGTGTLLGSFTVAGGGAGGGGDTGGGAGAGGSGVLGGRLYAGPPPISSWATPIDLSGTTVYILGVPITEGITVVDKAIAYANANPGTYTLVLTDNMNIYGWGGRPRLDTPNVNLTIIGRDVERTITQTETGSIFTVGIALSPTDDNISLTLGENITLVGLERNNMAAVTVRGGATLIMRDNARITGNTADTGWIGGINFGGSRLGGGVFMQGNSAGVPTTFTMRDNASIHGNSRLGDGGGVFVDRYATFNMHDNASVSGNSAIHHIGSRGGGVYLNGTFNMYGGTVYGNDVSASLANNASFGAALHLGSNSAVARFGDGTNIIATGSNANNTITGRP